MLHLVTSMRDIPFGSLCAIYREGNLENGAFLAPQEAEAQQLRLGEDRFYDFLHDFFRIPGAVYALWSDGGEYVSALRLEPWKDGLLLEALETAPDFRRKGYASQLIRAVQAAFPGKIYSHVSKRNKPSLKTHFSCGFTIASDFAAYVDGSVNAGAYTLVSEK